ncbi:unnamed protein product [Amoebophrya sp. A120]|nr:unnamed protein product [Amoebophrya sp. A120]|eukprot:GSA120T00000040001.1
MEGEEDQGRAPGISFYNLDAFSLDKSANTGPPPLEHVTSTCHGSESKKSMLEDDKSCKELRHGVAGSQPATRTSASPAATSRPTTEVGRDRKFWCKHATILAGKILAAPLCALGLVPLAHACPAWGCTQATCPATAAALHAQNCVLPCGGYKMTGPCLAGVMAAQNTCVEATALGAQAREFAPKAWALRKKLLTDSDEVELRQRAGRKINGIEDKDESRTRSPGHDPSPDHEPLGTSSRNKLKSFEEFLQRRFQLEFLGERDPTGAAIVEIGRGGGVPGPRCSAPLQQEMLLGPPHKQQDEAPAAAARVGERSSRENKSAPLKMSSDSVGGGVGVLSCRKSTFTSTSTLRTKDRVYDRILRSVDKQNLPYLQRESYYLQKRNARAGSRSTSFEDSTGAEIGIVPREMEMNRDRAKMEINPALGNIANTMNTTRTSCMNPGESTDINAVAVTPPAQQSMTTFLHSAPASSHLSADHVPYAVGDTSTQEFSQGALTANSEQIDGGLSLPTSTIFARSASSVFEFPTIPHPPGVDAADEGADSTTTRGNAESFSAGAGDVQEHPATQTGSLNHDQAHHPTASADAGGLRLGRNKVEVEPVGAGDLFAAASCAAEDVAHHPVQLFFADDSCSGSCSSLRGAKLSTTLSAASGAAEKSRSQEAAGAAAAATAAPGGGARPPAPSCVDWQKEIHAHWASLTLVEKTRAVLEANALIEKRAQANMALGNAWMLPAVRGENNEDLGAVDRNAARPTSTRCCPPLQRAAKKKTGETESKDIITKTSNLSVTPITHPLAHK